MKIAVNPNKAYRFVYVDLGQRIRLVFSDYSCDYIVARPSVHEYILINLGTGGRWTDSVRLNDVGSFLVGNDFKFKIPLQVLLGKELLYATKHALKFYQNNVEVYVKVYKVKS